MSLAGAIADARKSATRMYINNFADKDRQNTIDIVLVGKRWTVTSPRAMLGLLSYTYYRIITRAD
jgi:hypothetical protein